MSKPPITFRVDSLAARVTAFFRYNPEEELDVEAIATKFDVVRGNIHTQLARALEVEALVRERNAEGDYIYRGGKTLGKVLVPEAGVDMDQVHRSHPGEPSAVHSAPAPVPDPDDVTIDDDVPLPSAMTARRRDWTPLLQKLKTGQSFALPMKTRATLQKNITALHQAQECRFAVRVFKETEQLRVWRTA